MERVPAHLSYDAIGRALAGIPGVTGVHDLHVWHLSAARAASRPAAAAPSSGQSALAFSCIAACSFLMSSGDSCGRSTLIVSLLSLAVSANGGL